MKLRHAAALALTGWYLIVPPAPNIEPVPPLYKWVRLHDFDTQAQRELQMLRDLPARMNPGWTSLSGKFDRPTEQSPATERCIASDDPRLKPK
jgi:hypothetical protein